MRKIRILAAALAALLAVMLGGCGGAGAPDPAQDTAAVQREGTLVVGITDYAPMDYKDENGAWTGFDAELAAAFAARLGVDIEYVEIDWNNRFYELSSGAIDCIWNGMTITDEALANADVSDAYVVNAQVVVMDSARLAEYPDAASMQGLTFAAEAGSAGEEALQQAGLEDITALLTQADALMEVAAGAADACVIDITMANAMTGEGTGYAGLGYLVALTSEEYGVACRKGSDLTAQIDAMLADMRADGSLQQLADRYGLTLAGAAE